MTDNAQATTPTPQTDAATSAATEPESEKRSGFHPALVVSTIVVVLFVLWFCPRAIMRARITQNEAAALSVLSDQGQKYRLLNLTPDKVSRLLHNGKFKGDLDDLRLAGLNFNGAKSVTQQNNIAICLTPKYYGRTAEKTFLLIDGKVYAKNLAQQIPSHQIPTPDKSWEVVAVSK